MQCLSCFALFGKAVRALRREARKKCLLFFLTAFAYSGIRLRQLLMDLIKVGKRLATPDCLMSYSVGF